MVLNPIYTDSGSFGGSSDFRDRNLSLSVAQNPQYGTRAEVVPVTYETITDFPARPKAGTRLSQNRHSYGSESLSFFQAHIAGVTAVAGVIAVNQETMN